METHLASKHIWPRNTFGLETHLASKHIWPRNTFGLETQQFLSNYANTPRNLQPPPWNPGARVYDFYDSFSTATSTGPDKSLGAAGSVGNVVRKSVYSAVGGVITYIADLSAVI
jgi:hypothetical protein